MPNSSILRKPKQWRRHVAEALIGPGERRTARSIRLAQSFEGKTEPIIPRVRKLVAEPLFQTEQAARNRNVLRVIIVRAIAHANAIKLEEWQRPRILESDLNELFQYDPLFQSNHYFEKYRQMESEYGPKNLERLIWIANQLTEEAQKAIANRQKGKR